MVFKFNGVSAVLGVAVYVCGGKLVEMGKPAPQTAPAMSAAEYERQSAEITDRMEQDALLKFSPDQQLDIIRMMDGVADGLILDAEFKGCTGFLHPFHHIDIHNPDYRLPSQLTSQASPPQTQ